MRLVLPTAGSPARTTRIGRSPTAVLAASLSDASVSLEAVFREELTCSCQNPRIRARSGCREGFSTIDNLELELLLLPGDEAELGISDPPMLVTSDTVFSTPIGSVYITRDFQSL